MAPERQPDYAVQAPSSRWRVKNSASSPVLTAYCRRRRSIWAGVNGAENDRADATFVDLRTSDRRFATIDYSDDEPVLYLGESVDFEALGLALVREFEGW